MRKKKHLLVIFLLVVLLSYFTTSALSEYGSYTKESVLSKQEYIDKQKSDDDQDWKIANEGDVVLENQNFLLTLDSSTTRFVVLDKKTNSQYASFPSRELNIVSEEDRARAGSNLSLMYYDSSSKEHYMGTGNDSVSKKQFEIKVKDDRIRIYYTLGTSVSNLFVPVVFTKDVFENKILPALASNSDRRRIKLYYKLYSKDDKTDDYNTMASKYPALHQQDLYILTDEVDENIQEEISKFIVGSGYTSAEYQKTLKELNITASNDNVPVGFQIPLELCLNDDGLTATVLSDKIKENNSVDKLVKVYLLEYFGAADDQANGFFLVPDGSGSVINLNQQESQTYTQHYYNDDLAIQKTEQPQLSRNVSLPVFGLSSNQGSFFAVLNQSAAVASLYAKTMGGANPVNNIYCVFDLRSYAQTDIGQDRNMSTFNVYAKHIVYESPQIRYILIPNDKSSVSDMASVYRDYLKEDGIFKEKSVENPDLPLYIDFICMATQKANVFGISYNREVVLSDLKSIISVVNNLHTRGIKNLRIRLKGWNEGGIFCGLYDRFALDKKIGTNKELLDLSNLLVQNGGKLYLDTDFSFTSKNQPYDNVKLSLDISRTLDRSVASLQNYDRATLKYYPGFGMKYIITPMSYQKYISCFTEDLSKNSEFKNIGLSWSTGGMYLSSDFNPKTDYDMAMSAYATSRAFEKLSGAQDRMATDYGYDYVLPYVSDIINVPLTDSSFMAESVTVPFYQMVVSGYKNVSGPALNLTEQSEQVLDMAVSASAPYYMFITGDDKLLKLVNMDNQYYSLDYRKSIDKLGKTYQELNEKFKTVYGKTIVQYEILADQVTRTVFENGETIITNHSKSDFDYYGNKISANSYSLFVS